jgi:hypothetical protein
MSIIKRQTQKQLHNNRNVTDKSTQNRKTVGSLRTNVHCSREQKIKRFTF